MALLFAIRVPIISTFIASLVRRVAIAMNVPSAMYRAHVGLELSDATIASCDYRLSVLLEMRHALFRIECALATFRND